MSRRTKSQMKSELGRLLAIRGTYHDFMMQFEADQVNGEFEDEFSVEHHEQWIADGKATYGQLISLLQGELRGCWLQVEEWGRHDPAKQSAFLSFYTTRRAGRDFFIDVAGPKAAVLKILERGHIADEAEWCLVKEILDGGFQEVVGPKETKQLCRYFGQFEQAAKGCS